MLEYKEHVLRPCFGLPLMFPLPKSNPGREEARQSMFSPWTPSMPVPPPMPATPCHTPLVPNSLARPPHTWSKEEVRVWLEWCAGEFSIDPVSPDKFDMNGKALGLLHRADFMERDPASGDLLYNALQRLINKHDISPSGAFSSFSPVPCVTTTYNQHITQCPPLKQPPVHAHRTNGIIVFPGSPTTPGTQPTYSDDKPQSSYIPIRPGPVTSYPSNLQSSKDLSPRIPIPESVLSPALTNTESDTETEPPPEDEEGMDLRENIENRLHHSPESGISRDLTLDLMNLPHIKKSDGDCRLLWEFIHQLLQENRYRDYVSWERPEDLVFRIVNPTGLAELWGYQKNRTNMTYEKLSRALRYYYKMNIIKKVPGKRLTYQFLQHPKNIKKGQRGARPHSARIAHHQEAIALVSPISTREEPLKEAVSPPIREALPEEHKPIRSPYVDSYDHYERDCDLQFIDGRLMPVRDDGDAVYDGQEEDEENHHANYVKQEVTVPVQDEPEDLSMKSVLKRRNSENCDVSHIKSEDFVEEKQMKIEDTS